MATVLETCAKSHHFFIKFLFILFILVAFVDSATDPASNPSSKMASDTLFSGVSSAETVPAAASKTMEFHPRKRENSKPKGKDYGLVAGDEHEVPSGPNPISN